MEVVGATVGPTVGEELVGLTVGEEVVGVEVGDTVGKALGPAVVGACVGTAVEGKAVGENVGADVGAHVTPQHVVAHVDLTSSNTNGLNGRQQSLTLQPATSSGKHDIGAEACPFTKLLRAISVDIRQIAR